jgi:hypothetical protein
LIFFENRWIIRILRFGRYGIIYPVIDLERYVSGVLRRRMRSSRVPSGICGVNISLRLLARICIVTFFTVS